MTHSAVPAGPGRADHDPLFLGLDLGTSGLKAVAVDSGGEIVALASASYPTARPAKGAAEQLPEDWIAAVRDTLGQLAEQAAPERWRSLGLSAMIPTLVTVDAGGEPTGPAITWEDSRAEEHAARFRSVVGAGSLYQLTGQWVDGRYLLPMFLRLAESDPGRAATTALLLGAKDYLLRWLTGQTATDPSTATGFGCFALESGDWDPTALRAAAGLHGGPLPALPPVRPAATTLPLSAQAAATLGCGSLPVCVGAADSVLGAFGLGARAPGQIAYIAGTSTVILGVSAEPLRDRRHRFLVTPLAEPGLWGLEMDLLATGSALRWLAGLLGSPASLLDEAAIVALAASADPAAAPVVLPYLSPGEQGALWDPGLHGTIGGLTLAHGKADLARGLVTGIVLESRRCLAVLDEAAPFGADLFVAGGSAAEPAFRADLADATGRRVVKPAGPQASYSALGAATLAARALGHQLPAPGRPVITEAVPGQAAVWEALWAAHERARRAAGR